MTAPNGGPLDGVRVLDLIDGMGAYGPRLLCGMGADVIRVEPPGGSDHRRRRTAWTASDEETGNLYFLHYNAGKRGITLDAEQPRGREVLRSLLDTVDIVLDSGDLARWGFDLEELAAKQPPLVVVSTTPFGLEGERSEWDGCDLVCQAMSGMLGIYGYHGERPARFGPEQASEMSGLAAALGALIGLFSLRRSGRGDLIDIAVERVCALVTFQMSNASMYHQFGFVRERAERESSLPAGLYEASDGYFAFGAWRVPEQTLALLEEFGHGGELRALRESLPHEEFLADARSRAAVVAFAGEHTRAELVEIVQSRGMLGLPVNDARDLMEDQFLQRRAFFVEVEQPGSERPLLDAGMPIRFGKTPSVAGRRPPLVGEHNAEVYGRIGIDEQQLAELRRGGVV